MKKKFVKPWTDALRSGEYQQCQGSLKTDHGFCCLGVLTDVTLKQGVIKGEWVKNKGPTDQYTFRAENEVNVVHLPSSVATLVGISSSTGAFGGSHTLAGLNDKGATFLEIADIIEANWKKL
jgi:hypothetical protein